MNREDVRIRRVEITSPAEAADRGFPGSPDLPGRRRRPVPGRRRRAGAGLPHLHPRGRPDQSRSRQAASSRPASVTRSCGPGSCPAGSTSASRPPRPDGPPASLRRRRRHRRQRPHRRGLRPHPERAAPGPHDRDLRGRARRDRDPPGCPRQGHRRGRGGRGRGAAPLRRSPSTPSRRRPAAPSRARSCSPTGSASEGEDGIPSAAMSSNVGGMGAHWTCACPRPGGSERIGFLADLDELLDEADRLLGVSTRRLRRRPVRRRGASATSSRVRRPTRPRRPPGPADAARSHRWPTTAR